MIHPVRCAIYARKSSEEGLEQSFNSLDAQREACEAYIKSQKHEGWHIISTRYDDGGFSGGNMERPALKQLLADIHAGIINTVVVYKVDRLTRSLTDFARIIEQFDKSRVSFVSVTQQFNTTTSMGRLTLNVLLSFAQFEREITGERIRDKIVASKKKGMWVGGSTPFGYRARDHKLIVDEAEASLTRTIFQEFLRLKNVTNLREWLFKNNIRSRNGKPIYRGPIYKILRNPHYIGLIKHKDQTYPGEHTAIIDRETWDQVQAILGESRNGLRPKTRATAASLFTGILYNAEGTLYSPTHAVHHGRRYRYYTSQAIIKKIEKIEVPTRIPAPDIENAVVDRFLLMLSTPADLDKLFVVAVHEEVNSLPAGFMSTVRTQAEIFVATWESRPREMRLALFRKVIDRLILHPTRIEIRIRTGNLLQMLFQQQPLPASADTSETRTEPAQLPAGIHYKDIVTLETPFQHRPQSRAVKLIISNKPVPTDISHLTLPRAIARARLWYEQLVDGTAKSISQLATMHGISLRYVTRIIRLASLSPQSVEAILAQPEYLPRSINDLLTDIPLCWSEQRIGMSASAVKVDKNG